MRQMSHKSNHRNNSRNRSTEKKKEIKAEEFMSKADGNGRVYFNNLPEDNYNLIMSETNDFLAYSK